MLQSRSLCSEGLLPQHTIEFALRKPSRGGFLSNYEEESSRIESVADSVRTQSNADKNDCYSLLLAWWISE